MYLLLAFFGIGVTYLMAAFFASATLAGYAIALNSFYRPWLYWADPMTYFFEPTIATVLHGVEVQCTPDEMAVFDPPSGQTCQQYVAQYLERNAGYLTNPSGTQQCSYCPYSVGDDFAETLHYFYKDRWRDWAVFLGFCLTNFLLVVSSWKSRSRPAMASHPKIYKGDEEEEDADILAIRWKTNNLFIDIDRLFV
ncbi:ATP-binding cassette transporter snq2 [Aspergillus melleus]|uniref:ATP-binding cassette transporter snq2 n=1 Tax=Aspergillus melleus TaxID=138277 RepID=A0ACC3B940_9EURO|nr:ATP-binding cassette transporter snq2 [Aspergillus melleus]